VLTEELRDVRERRRVRLSSAADGERLAALLRAVGAEAGLRCWLLTGTGQAAAGVSELPRPVTIRLAARYAKAGGEPGGVLAEGEDGLPCTLFPVGAAARAGERVTGWFLACAGTERDWTPVAARVIADLETEAVVERARLTARLAGERGLAEAVIGRLAAGGGESGETEALLRSAGMRAPYLAVALRAGPASDAERDRRLAEELLTQYAGRAAVAICGDEILAVVSSDQRDLAGRLRELAPVLRAARIRVSIGLSSPVTDVAGLAGALREASGARRAAALRQPPDGDGSVLVTTSAEVDSHELLLASVPTPVLRSFRDRLLGPLAEYDARHNAELLPTLRSFLACDGSWIACASRMYVHVNTVRYRIGRIEALTGRDLSALPDRVDFFLALRGAGRETKCSLEHAEGYPG